MAHLCRLGPSAIAQPLYADDPLGVDLVQSLYALDSTTLDLSMSVFPWARFRKHKGAVKMHRLLDLRGNIHIFIRAAEPRFALKGGTAINLFVRNLPGSCHGWGVSCDAKPDWIKKLLRSGSARAFWNMGSITVSRNCGLWVEAI